MLEYGGTYVIQSMATKAESVSSKQFLSCLSSVKRIRNHIYSATDTSGA